MELCWPSDRNPDITGESANLPDKPTIRELSANRKYPCVACEVPAIGNTGLMYDNYR